MMIGETQTEIRKASAMERFLKIAIGAMAFLALAALVATAFMVLASDSGRQSAGDDDGAVPASRPEPPPLATAAVWNDPSIGEIPNSASDWPVLTESQISEVKSVLNSDERLAAVLSGEPFAVTRMGPWVVSDGLVGALVLIELDNPVSYTGSLPTVGSPLVGEGYLAGKVLAQATGIESLEMLVDLKRRVVANIRIERATGEVRLDYGMPRPIPVR